MKAGTVERIYELSPLQEYYRENPLSHVITGAYALKEERTRKSN